MTIAFSRDGRYLLTSAPGGDRLKSNRPLWERALVRLFGSQWAWRAEHFTYDHRAGLAIWKLEAMTEVARLIPGERVTEAVFSESGHLVRLRTRFAHEVWDVRNATRLLRVETPDVPAALSPRGDALVVGHRLIDLDTGAEAPVLEGVSGPVTSVVWSPDGRLVVLSDQGGSALVFRADTGARVRSFEVAQNATRPAAFSADGRRLCLTVSDPDPGARLFEVDGWRQCAATPLPNAASPGPEVRWDAHSAAVGGVLGGFSPEQIREGLDSRQPADPTPTDKGRVTFAAFSPDGERILIGDDAQAAWLWEWERETLIELDPGDRSKPFLSGGSFSPDGHWLLCRRGDDLDDETLRIGDEEYFCYPGIVAALYRATGERDREWGAQPESPFPQRREVSSRAWDVSAVAWSPAGTYAAIEGGGGVHLFRFPGGSYFCSVFSLPAGRWAVVGEKRRESPRGAGVVQAGLLLPDLQYEVRVRNDRISIDHVPKNL